MSHEWTLEDLPNVTFLQESEDGPTPCALPDGPTIDPFGPDRAPASLSARQAKEQGLTMSGIYGRPGTGSFASVDLASSLASKLRQRLGLLGSTLFRLTWKVRVTPSGRSIYALRASALSTSGNDSGSWPTPNAGPQNDTDTEWENRREKCKAKWGNNGFGLTLGMATQLASWPTPNVPNGGRIPKGGSMSSTGQTPAGKKRQVDIQWVAKLTTLGETPNGCPAETEKPGRLNPAFPRWLMGYPPEWDDCAATATPLSRK